MLLNGTNTVTACVESAYLATPHLYLLLAGWCCCQVYYEPMLKLDIMTESELGQIFGTLDSLIPLHEGKMRLLETLTIKQKKE